ncbi:hypothetical protein GT021_24240 [Streptomyces sp. SID5470]|uniref:Secreted protein n=1 Tax=Streptomyces sviceus (strain ATCC 29083 / DSM 924 / JCM 4929 / NBRC 13980 / NCIMB 11184 / NRRL 5439 / UC 5370) TaxID=463191 RepID=B5HYE6_STRX2|nr:secreted protein [Streptomyces sviceus ATCC 29083]MYT07478.1 hypothetical protein [Streptomyces sp. SID5470]
MHRLLPPSAIAGVSLVCAFGPWVFSQQAVLRVIAAFAAAVAVVGAAVMRRWDAQAGKQVADLTRARASDEWRHEERVAELETDLEESRELRVKLEQRLRAKRAELAGLRNEHAALLRRYATAETERASALEGRRLLEIEAAPARALPSAEPADGQPVAVAAEDGPETEAEAGTEAPGKAEDAKTSEGTGTSEDTEEKPERPAIFSPEGSRLFLRANAALKRLDEDGGDGPVKTRAKVDPKTGPKAEADSEKQPSNTGPAAADTAGTDAEAAQEDEARGKPEAVDGHERAAATTTARAAQPQQPAGHFIAPTAVAVVPTAPVRRPRVEGGFDFFGTKAGASKDALEAVQNEDLADVVGQEALALHKAESESEFKPADEESRGIGQVIDLTAHDETEQIDLQGLRSAVS